MNGTIKRVISDKGFGFVKDEATGTEYFFHRSAVRSSSAKRFEHFREGDAVIFEEDPAAAKGPRVLSLEAATVAR